MTTVANAIRAMAPKVAAKAAGELSVVPDLGQADLYTIAAIIYVAIGKGCDTDRSLHTYLEDRGCNHPRATISFLLTQFDGGDSRHCLWRRDKTGRYSVIEPLNAPAYKPLPPSQSGSRANVR